MNDSEKELQELIEKNRRMMAEIIEGLAKLSESIAKTTANLEKAVNDIKESI